MVEYRAGMPHPHQHLAGELEHRHPAWRHTQSLHGVVSICLGKGVGSREACMYAKQARQSATHVKARMLFMLCLIDSMPVVCKTDVPDATLASVSLPSQQAPECSLDTAQIRHSTKIMVLCC